MSSMQNKCMTKRELLRQMKGDDGERIVVAFNDTKENGLEITALEAAIL